MSLIRLENVSRLYQVGDETIRALRNVSLRIEKGEYVAVMGPSGSGKSTLMNLLGCLDLPTKGTVELNGIDVSKADDNFLSEVRNREIGFVFQSYNLLPRSTAQENVELPMVFAGVTPSVRRKRAIELLQEVGLGHRLDHRPNELSGGQCQRVAIARALANSPSILLADEPTGNLDSKTGQEIMALMETLVAKGHTIILVTHEEEVANFARRVVRIRDGIVASDHIVRRPAPSLVSSIQQQPVSPTLVS
jgi:putative ABC transport system ATP-binding protein